MTEQVPFSNDDCVVPSGEGLEISESCESVIKESAPETEEEGVGRFKLIYGAPDGVVVKSRKHCMSMSSLHLTWMILVE